MFLQLLSYAERYGFTLTLSPIDPLNPRCGYHASLEGRPGMWGSANGKITRDGDSLHGAANQLYECALSRHCA